jgi:hypothetical protein
LAEKPQHVVSEIILDFADDKYLFRLGLKQIAELQEKCNAGIGAIFARVLQGRMVMPNGDQFGNPMQSAYRHEDLRETIRLGLIGGGLDPVKAFKLIERYIDGQPLRLAWDLAAAILAACIEGYIPPEGVKETGEAGAVREVG